MDLIQLDDHLIISPVMKGSSVSLKTESDSVDDVKRFLLSSYVRGFEYAELTAKKRFTDEQICGARSFVRFLDERLVLNITETRIAFGRNSAGVPQGSSTIQMQALLFDKLAEAMRLTAELIDHFDRNKRRAIHLMQMLRLLEEDVDRLAFQILRQASRMEMPFESLADLHYAVLTTSLMENISDSVFGTVRDVCKIYGIDHNKLLFPAETLLADIRGAATRLEPSLETIRHLYTTDFKECETYLEEIKGFTLSEDAEKAYSCKEDLVRFRDELGVRLGNAVNGVLVEGVSSGRGSDMAQVLRIGYRIADIATKLEELAKLSVTFHFPGKRQD